MRLGIRAPKCRMASRIDWKRTGRCSAEIGGTAAEARDGASALSRRSDEASLGVELLRDIRDEVFAGIDRIRSQELVNKLTAMEDRPWPDMPYTGKQITHAQVARLLKPYNVKPDQVRFGEQTFKGYRLFLQMFRQMFRQKWLKTANVSLFPLFWGAPRGSPTLDNDPWGPFEGPSLRPATYEGGFR